MNILLSNIKFIALLLVALVVYTNAHAQTVYPGYVDGQLYVKIRTEFYIDYTGKTVDATTLPFIKPLVEKYSITQLQRPFYIKQAPGLGQIFRVYFNQYIKVDELIAELQKEGMVEYAEKVPLMKTMAIPNDLGTQSYSNGNWSLFKINAQQAWDLTTGNPNITIAIVDNAVQTTHADLAGNIWINPGEIAGNSLDDDLNGFVDDVNGFDVADDDDNPNPPDTSFVHGTHCAGIASAKTNNGTGMAGIGYNCKIIAVKVTADADGGDVVTVPFDGVVYAAAAGANVISISWGGPNSSLTEQTIFDTVYALGITVCAGAGNAGLNDLFYPAAYNHVIAVASTGNNGPTDVLSSFSNYGTWVDVSAPGSKIRSTVPFDGYAIRNGTSMAAPLVAGLAGLILSVNPTLTPDEVESCLRTTADNTDAANPGYIGEMGSGRINAFKAVECALTGITENHFDGKAIIYPNPANSIAYVAIELLAKAPIAIKLYNGMGQIIAQQNHAASLGGKFTLPVSGLGSGIYFVEISTGAQRLVKKLVLVE